MMEPLCDATVTHSFLMSVAEEGAKQNSSRRGASREGGKKNYGCNRTTADGRPCVALLCSCTGTRAINEFE